MDEFEERNEDIDGINKWLWIKGDTGLWDGPAQNWKESHKAKILKHCENFQVVVQAGGGCGMYPRLLANIFSIVYTFEPDDSNFHCLVNNCWGRKVVMFNTAVGDTNSLVSMKRGSESNRGTHRVEEKACSYIPQITIDSIKYRQCDLIWLDIEGYEDKALKGAMETIHKFKPIIMAERGTSFEDWMKKIGYEKVDQSVSDTIFKPQNV